MTKTEQKVLNFIIENPQVDYLAPELQKQIKISKAGINLALKSLIKQALVSCKKRGKTFLYSMNFEDPEIKELKKLNNIKKLKSFVKQLSRYSVKIVLFGSAGRGENFKDSDIDLFILTRTPKRIKNFLIGKQKLQTIVKTPLEYISFEKDNPVLMREINNGIVLWQQH